MELPLLLAVLRSIIKVVRNVLVEDKNLIRKKNVERNVSKERRSKLIINWERNCFQTIIIRMSFLAFLNAKAVI